MFQTKSSLTALTAGTGTRRSGLSVQLSTTATASPFAPLAGSAFILTINQHHYQHPLSLLLYPFLLLHLLSSEWGVTINHHHHVKWMTSWLPIHQVFIGTLVGLVIAMVALGIEIAYYKYSCALSIRTHQQWWRPHWPVKSKDFHLMHFSNFEGRRTTQRWALQEAAVSSMCLQSLNIEYCCTQNSKIFWKKFGLYGRRQCHPCVCKA